MVKLWQVGRRALVGTQVGKKGAGRPSGVVRQPVGSDRGISTSSVAPVCISWLLACWVIGFVCSQTRLSSSSIWIYKASKYKVYVLFCSLFYLLVQGWTNFVHRGMDPFVARERNEEGEEEGEKGDQEEEAEGITRGLTFDEVLHLLTRKAVMGKVRDCFSLFLWTDVVSLSLTRDSWGFGLPCNNSVRFQSCRVLQELPCCALQKMLNWYKYLSRVFPRLIVNLHGECHLHWHIR